MERNSNAGGRMIEDLITADGYLIFTVKRVGDRLDYSYKTERFRKSDLPESIKQFESHARRDFLNDLTTNPNSDIK